MLENLSLKNKRRKRQTNIINQSEAVSKVFVVDCLILSGLGGLINVLRTCFLGCTEKDEYGNSLLVDDNNRVAIGGYESGKRHHAIKDIHLDKGVYILRSISEKESISPGYLLTINYIC